MTRPRPLPGVAGSAPPLLTPHGLRARPLAGMKAATMPGAIVARGVRAPNIELRPTMTRGLGIPRAADGMKSRGDMRTGVLVCGRPRRVQGWTPGTGVRTPLRGRFPGLGEPGMTVDVRANPRSQPSVAGAPGGSGEYTVRGAFAVVSHRCVRAKARGGPHTPGYIDAAEGTWVSRFRSD